MSELLVSVWDDSTWPLYSNLSLFSSRNNCLNEPHLFLVLSGAYIGLSQWFNLHMKNGNLLTFPPIQMHGSSQLKLRIWTIVVKATTDAFWDLRWFYLFYFIYGEILH